MSRITEYKKSLLIILAISTIACAFNVYSLLSNPYGDLFWYSVYSVIALITITVFIVIQLYIKENKWLKWSLLLGALIFPILFISLKLDYRTILFPDTKQVLTKHQWQDDLMQLVSAIKEQHPNYQAMIDKQVLEQRVYTISQNIDKWNDKKIKIEFIKLLASLNDGHSIIPPQAAINFHILPIVMHEFSDGVYIINAGRHLSHLIGAKVTKIGTKPVREVFSKMKPYIGAENIGNKWDRFPLYGAVTELLYEEGISSSPSNAEVTLELNGETISILIEGKPFYQWALMYFYPAQNLEQLPYNHNSYANHFWTRFDKESQLLYVNINELKDDSTYSVEDFARHLKTLLDKANYKKVVIDIRQNRGGDNFKARSIVKVIRESEYANIAGRLFVFTSRRTYSAATNFASLMENQTHAVFVGEPTGQGPNHYGDPKGFRLNHSGIWVAISTATWRGSFQQDTRKAIYPHIPIEYDFDDYLNGRDPALEAALNYRVSLSDYKLAEQLTTKRYLTKEGQLVWLEQKGDSWSLNVNDFSQISLNVLRIPILLKEGMWLTSLRDLKIKELRNDIQLYWQDKNIELTEVASDYLTPFQHLYSKNLADIQLGVKQLKEHGEYAYLNEGGEVKIRSYGYEFFNSNEPAKAALIFDYIRWFNDDYSYAWSRLAYAQLRMGDLELSHTNFKRALELNPNNRTASDMLIRLKQLERHD